MSQQAQTFMADAAVIVKPCSLEELRGQVRREPGALFAVLDACDEPRVPAKVSELGQDVAVSLYAGRAEQDYWAIAPYLARADEELLDWIVAELWGSPWGVFVVAAADLAAVRKHFRRFLMVLGPHGERLYFRYYDPRVLPTFLSTCAPAEQEEFFGPIRRFCVQGEGSDLTAFERDRRNRGPGFEVDRAG